MCWTVKQCVHYLCCLCYNVKYHKVDSGGENSPATNFVCLLLFGFRSSPVLLQQHVKDPGHSAKSAGGRLHLNTYTPMTHRSKSGQTMPLSRQSVGIYQETRSHTTCEGTLVHSRLSSLSHCGLILAKEWNNFARANLHYKKRVQAGNELSFSQNPCTRGKSHHQKPPMFSITLSIFSLIAPFPLNYHHHKCQTTVELSQNPLLK